MYATMPAGALAGNAIHVQASVKTHKVTSWELPKTLGSWEAPHALEPCIFQQPCISLGHADAHIILQGLGASAIPWHRKRA